MIFTIILPKSESIIDYLTKKEQPSDLEARGILAKEKGILAEDEEYEGTEKQNLKLLETLRDEDEEEEDEVVEAELGKEVEIEVLGKKVLISITEVEEEKEGEGEEEKKGEEE